MFPIISAQPELRLSQRPGIVDIYAGGRLINNLVVLVAWDDASGRHYNNSEMQSATPTVRRDARGRISELSYSFSGDERSPTRQPASRAVVTVDLRYANDGRVIMTPHLSGAPPGARFGVGSFYGVRHGTFAADVGGTTVYGGRGGGNLQMGQWARHQNAGRVTLSSVYRSMPSLTYSTLSPNSWVDTERRDKPWLPEQDNMARSLRGRTGGGWIESAILYGEPEHEFELRLR